MIPTTEYDIALSEEAVASLEESGTVIDASGSFTLTEEQAAMVGVVMAPSKAESMNLVLTAHTTGDNNMGAESYAPYQQGGAVTEKFFDPRPEPKPVRYMVTMNCPPKSPRRNGPCECGSGKKYKKCCGVK